MALLGAGGGSGTGLEDLVTEMLRQQAMNETIRHNQATEKQGQDTLASLSEERAALAEARRQSIEDRQTAMTAETDRRNRLRDFLANTTDQSPSAVRLRNFMSADTLMPKGEHIPYQLLEEPGSNVNSEQKTYRLTDPTLAQQFGMKVGDVIDADYNPRTLKRTYRGVDVTAGTGNYERPQAPAVVLTGTGYQAIDKTNKTASPILGQDQKPVQGPEPAAMRMSDRNAQRANETLDRLSQLTDEAERRGLLGPAAGRASDFLAGTIGSTGNAEDDQLLGALKLDMNTIPAQIALSIGEGARGASSVQLLQNWKVLFGPKGPDVMRGAISETRKLLQKPGQSQTGQGALPNLGDMFNGGKVLSITPVK